jgi:hypothetical protein
VPPIPTFLMQLIQHDQHFFHKANAENLCSLYEGHLNEMNTKLDEMTQTAEKTVLWSESDK